MTFTPGPTSCVRQDSNTCPRLLPLVTSSCRPPAPDASLTSLSSTLAGPSRLPKALLLPHHTPAYFPAALSWGAHGPMREGCTHLCVDPEAPCQAAGSSGPGTWPPHPPLLVGISGTLSERPCERGRNLGFVSESYERTTFLKNFKKKGSSELEKNFH